MNPTSEDMDRWIEIVRAIFGDSVPGWVAITAMKSVTFQGSKAGPPWRHAIAVSHDAIARWCERHL